jgi:hypothetical protein
MALDDRILHLTLDCQRRIFRLAERDYGLSIKAIGLDSGIPYTTVRTYAAGEAVMPVTALVKLVGVIPDGLLSQLLDPASRCIVRIPAGVDYDEVSSACRAFIDHKEQAHHPESEAGRDIGPGEQESLGKKVVELKARA